MKPLALLAVLLLSPVLHADQKADDIAMAIAAGLDIASTEIAIARGAGHEGNMLLQRRAVRIGSKVALVAVVSLLERRLRRGGHNRAATIIETMVVWGSIGATGWNLQVSFGR